MAEGVHWRTLLVILNAILIIHAQVLTPPTFNLAKGRKIVATATCGYGVSKPELYCRLTGATGDKTELLSREIIQGQLCDYCDPSDPMRNYSAQNAIDGSDKFWQSPPLSRGEEFNKVDLVLDLEQEFHIAYIVVTMANSPRPGVWALEKSSDHGQTYEPWQYFADTPSECMKLFNIPADQIPRRDDQVLCVTDFSKIVPLKDGEIFVSLTNNRPNAQNFSYADNLKKFMKATNVRFRLLRTKTLLGHLIGVQNQDPTVTRRYFYSIKDISLGGRCVCNGHSDTCNYLDPSRPNRLICDCQHNTVGDQCERCDAANGFVQKKWQPVRAASAFECEPCQCYGRATDCEYDLEVDAKGLSVDIHGVYSGGGVCINCGYYSTGINCEKCLSGYYRPKGTLLTALNMCTRCSCNLQFHIDECEEETGRCICRKEYTGYYCDSCAVGYYGYPNCIPCDCDVNGTAGNICHVNGGQCPCKENYVGKKCDMCQRGYYDFPLCQNCSCDSIGSQDGFCDTEKGHCHCKLNYGSRDCSMCAHGYYNYPDCTFCSCEHQGALEVICNKSSGKCLCKSTFDGGRCEKCARGYYAYPDCMACQCKEPGSTSNICQDNNGQCTCRPNYAGQNCERCAPGFYKYPDCVSCNCDNFGSLGVSCDQETGQCDCKYNFQGLVCNKCKVGLYNYPNCEECNCNPAGAKDVPGYPLGGCGEVITGRLCECKEKVIGRICDTCTPGYWNLNRNNPRGCEECSCSDAGTIAGVNICNMITGQCMCKVAITGLNCDRCKDGYFGLHKQNLFGCLECNCDIGGSESPVCNKETGQCICKPRVQGRRCDGPIRQHFIPTLDQLKYEVEDGYTPDGAHVRYGYDDRLFPNFSWKGYAILMRVQPEVRLNIDINKPSLYRVLFRYVNMNDKTVKGEVILDPESVSEISQKSHVYFTPSTDPAFVSVGSGLVMNHGKWMVSIKTDESVFLDYMILIPQAYYEATVLQNTVYRPCLVPSDDGPCIHYSYPDVVEYARAFGEDGFIIDGDSRVPVRLFTDQNVLDELKIKSMAVLDPSQNSFNMSMSIPNKDRYVFVINYYAKSNKTQILLFNIGDVAQATAVLYNCQYSSLCRQVLLTLDEMEGIFELDKGNINIQVTGDNDVSVAIESIVAIPHKVWSIGYVSPSIVCIRINGKCAGSRYGTPVGSVRIEFEELPNDHLLATEFPPALEDFDIGLIRLNDTLDMIVLLGEARSPGQHKFVVHYYLPYDIGTDMSVTLFANGQEYRGHFSPQYCPGVNGCRGLIFFDETAHLGNINLIDPNVKIMFNNTSGQQIWLDYLLLIPSSQYNVHDINILPVDNSKNFIDTCLDKGFKIITPISDFCEKSLFTLTTEFNNGAIECECNTDGSLSFNCDPYGGQCQCRPNVIGRTCSACKVGHYGFPRCQPCNCPFGLCTELTGQCICPPRVTGDRCDICKPATYGYDALIGCQECQCNPQGTVDGNLNCHEETGQCQCLEGIGGRKCEFCLAGFYAFPQCRECDCERYGTTEAICDPKTAICICKDNVIGARCDQCDAFTYNIEPTNPNGCTNCFCFGNTANCKESYLRWDMIMDMQSWSITNTIDGSIREAGNVIALLDAVDKTVNTNVSMYWVAPQSYLGNKVNSYGGYLHYSVLFVLPRNDSIETLALYEPDIILVGNNMTIVHTSVNQPYTSTVTAMKVHLYEYNFKHINSGLTVDRSTFMMVLVNLRTLYIRASYYSVVKEVRLMDVKLDIASADGTGELATSVESCVCPRGYVGSSCENCAKGYHRAKGNYQFLGVCVLCDCNRHTDNCDVNTGQCLGCGDNTMGLHCELCRPGYHGDPSKGSCSICGCPLPIESNNFADHCFVSTSGVVTQCECYKGFAGDTCDRCASGYYGDPRIVNSTCRLCQCNDNIDMNDPDSCDDQTGQCLRCINNSSGQKCESCTNWYYGDAVGAKDCTECSCDTCGTLMCNSRDGHCTCKPNVIGSNCDACAPDMYGYDECNGCIPCDCALASVSSQCDLKNGSCQCKDGVTGDKCEKCAQNYWNYHDAGCLLCNCEFAGAVTCDPENGRCVCLPGVTGPTCDQCFERWVLVPQQGCQECDTCTHHLLDDMDFLNSNITDIQIGLQSVSIGVEAMKRLDHLNWTLFDLQSQVMSVLYETTNITLDPYIIQLDEVNIKTNNVLAEAATYKVTVEGLSRDSTVVRNRSADSETQSRISEQQAEDAVMYIKEILRQINEGIKVTNIETYITMSEQIIDEIQARNFSNQKDINVDEIKMTEELLEIVKDKQTTPKDQNMFIDFVNVNVNSIKTRLSDLQNSSERSQAISLKVASVLYILQNVTIASISANIEQISAVEDMTEDTIFEVFTLQNTSNENLDVARKEFENLEKVQSQMFAAIDQMVKFNKIFEIGLPTSAKFVNESNTHAQELEEDATKLEKMYTDTRHIAANAVTAGRAYENIVKAIDDARIAAEKALVAADSAYIKSGGVGEVSQNLTLSSDELLSEAAKKFNITQTGLSERLNETKTETSKVENLYKTVKNFGDQMKKRMSQLPLGNAGNRTNQVNEDGQKAVDKVNGIKTRIKDILDDIPRQLEKTGPLAIDAFNTNKDIGVGKTQVGNVQKFVPDIQKLLSNLTGQSERVQDLGLILKMNISELKEKIAVARNQANLIKVGLKFLGNTSVTLRNPPNVAQAGSYNQVELFFKTDAKDGLLLYAGNEKSRGTRPNQDYMSLEIENGNVVFKYDLGTGPAYIKHPHYVSDGAWYKLTAKRIGTAGTLVIESDPSKLTSTTPVKGSSKGIATVLAMHPLTTKFFLGSLPSDSMVSDNITKVNYVGVMEGIEFDDVPMGLWNFEAGVANYVGAKARNILTSVISNGFQFDGMGYVILSTAKTGWKPLVKSQVSMTFKTYAENGLLFFAGKERDFISIELRDGEVLHQYNLGSGAAVLRFVNKKVNDGEWHEVQVNRLDRTGYLFVDRESGGPVESPGNMTQMSITDDIAIGGYHDIIVPVSDVTNQGFDGCIKDVSLQLAWDLHENKRSKGVIPGCPEQIARVATFNTSKLAYVAKPVDSLRDNFNITFKMKTTQQEALLLYAANTDTNGGFSVSTIGGKISVISDPGGAKQELMTRVNTYNDGRWHYISIMKTRIIMQLNVDDYERIAVEEDGPGNTFSITTDLFFGNANINISKDLTASTQQLNGCIGDVTINGDFLNFASLPLLKRHYISLSGCHIPDPVGLYMQEALPTQLPFVELTTELLTTPTMAPGKCALDRINPIELGDDQQLGLRFGAYPVSRVEYDSLPDSLRLRSKLSLDFRTTYPDGVIFYFADAKHVDHISITMTTGRIRYTFDSGTGTGVIVTERTYNDGQWHKLDVGRSMTEGTIMIDGAQVGFVKSPGQARSINGRAPYYFGGIDSEDLPEQALKNLDNVKNSFIGCLANIQLNGQSVGQARIENGTQPCSNLTEAGAYFYGDGGYIKLVDSFSVGVDLSIQIEIKPRSIDGLIFSVHGSKGDYVVLQLVDGEVWFTADNGDGPITAKFVPEMNNKLCNGMWHTIIALKNKNVVTLTVDNNNNITTTSAGSANSTDTNNPIYIGGKPDSISKGVRVNGQYLGCMRNLSINGVIQYLTTGTTFSNVDIEGCPVN